MESKQGQAAGPQNFVAAIKTFALFRWRPVLSAEYLLLGLCLYFMLAGNTAFWRALLAEQAEFGAGLTYAFGVGAALTALQFLLFAPFLNRWTTKPLLGVLILIAGSTSYFSSNFGVYYNKEMLRNVLETNTAEASELLTTGLLLHLLIFALPPLFIVLRARFPARGVLRAFSLRVGSMMLAAVLAVGALVSVYKEFSSQMRNHKQIRHLVTPVAPVWSLIGVLSQNVQSANVPRQPLGLDAKQGTSWQAAQKPALFVIVLGETARGTNWGLNRAAGLQTIHDTTPELAKRGVINFPEVTSCGTSTEVSLPCMFSNQGRRNYDEEAIQNSESLLNVLQHAGLRVVWNDNQSGCKGVCTGVESIRPDPATLPQLCKDEHCFDEALVESSRALIQDSKGNLVLVLHQLGNHGPAYFKRYPETFRRFLPTCDVEDLSKCSREQIVNSYDNALLYTDHVLARTIDLLKSLEAKYDTAMLYVSDHGESLGENNLYLHGTPFPIAPRGQTHVPMVMWFSDGFAARNRLNLDCMQQRARADASHDHLFHTVLGLLDIHTSVRDNALDLSAACRSR